MGHIQDRIIYPDLIRIIATFMVIILHVNASKWYTSPVYGFNWQVMNVYGCLVRSSVPLFFMVSGMFMLDTNKELNLKKLFCHHILPILASLLLFQFFYDVFWFIGGNIKHFGETKLDIVDFFIDYFRHLLFAPYYHLWFLYTLIGLYILTPIIRVGLKNAVEKDIKYLMIVFFVDYV